MMKHVILFLAANPNETDRLALDREARSIRAELKRSSYRDQFDLVTRWAAEPLDLLREVRELKPTVVHFSGHGGRDTVETAKAAHNRDVIVGASCGEELQGLYFHDAAGHMQFVSAEAIAQTLGAAGASVRLVVLNACFSDQVANVLLAHVAFVVGISGSIHDDAARSFAIGFYGGLGESESISTAFAHGRAAISLEGLSDADRPQFRMSDRVDASLMFLSRTAADVEKDTGVERDTDVERDFDLELPPCGASPHQEAARPIHNRIIAIVGILAAAAILAGIVAIVLETQSLSEFTAFGVALRTGSVGIGCIGVGLLAALVATRSVLRSQQHLAALPPDDVGTRQRRKRVRSRRRPRRLKSRQD